MKDNVDDIRDFYDARASDEESRLATHQLEYDLTLKYLDRYLPTSGRSWRSVRPPASTRSRLRVEGTS